MCEEARIARLLRGLLLAWLLLSWALAAPTQAFVSHDAHREHPVDLAALRAAAPANTMVTVPAGPFLMGTARAPDTTFDLALQYDDTEQPQRRVWLDAFEIDRDEVSLGAYLAWLHRQQRQPPPTLRHLITHALTVHAVAPQTIARWPAIAVSWADAAAFCRERAARLPTEAEWEKAARGDEARLFPWGAAAPTADYAQFGYEQAHEVPRVAPVDSGELGRSPYGLRHMAGNAAEWVADWFGIDAYATMPLRNPTGPASGRYKVVRGGSWKSRPMLLRTATRSGAVPERQASTIGFRCARSPAPVPSPSTPSIPE